MALALLVRNLWADDADRDSAADAISRRAQVGELVLCGLWILWLGGVATVIGQSAESFVPLMWLGGAVAARRGRSISAGILIGASAAMKAWGLLGLPLVLLDDDDRGAALAAAVAAGVALASYVPFFAFGSVGSFSYHWTVSKASPLHFVFPAGSTFTWAGRVLQGAVVLGGGSVLALFARRSRVAVWALPLALVTAKVLVDPVYYWYYWVPAQTLALVGIVTLALFRRSTRDYVVAGGLYLTLFLSTDHGPLLGVASLLVVVAAIAVTRGTTTNMSSRFPKEVVSAARAS